MQIFPESILGILHSQFIPYGNLLNRYLPRGVAKVHNLLDSLSSGTFQKALVASKVVKYCEFFNLAEISSILGSLKGCDIITLFISRGSRHNLNVLLDFFVKTNEFTHSDVPFTFSIMSKISKFLIQFLNSFCSGIGTDQTGCTTDFVPGLISM